MEVGIGARLDATVTIPDGAVVSALASINFNRQEFLGNTVTGLRELGDGGDCEEETVRVGEAEVPRGGKARTGMSGVIWSAVEPTELLWEDLRNPTFGVSLSIVPLLPLSGKLSLHVHTNCQIWEWPRQSSPSCSRTLRVHISS